MNHYIFYKYSPKEYQNSKIPANNLIGKIPIHPRRTRFNMGVYLTTYRGVNSRYLEDVLAIGYSPGVGCEAYYADIVRSGFELFDNKDQPLTFPGQTRVWPAFGQIGGAFEAIAIPKGGTNCLKWDYEKDSIGKSGLSLNSNKFISMNKFADLSTGPRYQLMRTDAVTKPVVLERILVLLLLKTIQTNENNDSIAPSKGDNDDGIFVKISSSGVVIKSILNGEQFTLSAGYQEQHGNLYVYLIGSIWYDITNSNNDQIRRLFNTEAFIFSWNLNQNLSSSPNIITEAYSTVINEAKLIVNNPGAHNSREIVLPRN
ncbi:MAG: hypothetical protein ACYCSG_06710 [Thermoplasmataceae archaeon]